MSYTLDITFTGMCGFVPVDEANERAVHVLFPNTARPDAHGSNHEGHEGHEGQGHMEAHVSRLLFDVSALEKGALEPRGMPVVVSLRNAMLVLGDGTTGVNPRLTTNLMPLEFLKPGFLGDAANEFITTRVVLRDGAEVWNDPGAVWKDEEGNERPMSHRLIWRMQGRAESLRLTLRSLEGKPDRELPELHPDAEGRISLHILHVPPAELPPEPQDVPEPKPDTVAGHVGALNILVTKPLTRLPRFVKRLDTPRLPELEPRIDEAPIRGLSPYACMGGRIALSTDEE